MNAFRSVAVAFMVAGFVTAAQGQVPFEDTFDGPTLGSTWTAMGGGAYTVNGDLEFTTVQGDYHPDFRTAYGTPQHSFLMSPGVSEWTAVTRVRYNTPDEAYEQANLLAYGDNGSYVKVGYESGYFSNRYFQEQYAGQGGSHGVAGGQGTNPMTDYFWLRLDREDDRYAGFFSTDSTTDPNAVNWTYLGQVILAIGDDPMAGVGGWNTFPSPSGELAEFDYYRVGALIPEPTTLLLLLGGFAAALRRRVL